MSNRIIGAPAWRFIAHSAAAQAAHTGTTDETAIVTVAIPAGAMGANGILRVSTRWTVNNDASAKTVAIRMGSLAGAQFSSTALANQLTQRNLWEISNRNSASSQIAWVSGAGASGFGNSTGAFSTSSLNTATAWDLLLTGTLVDSADSITLESYAVEVHYQAT